MRQRDDDQDRAVLPSLRRPPQRTVAMVLQACADAAGVPLEEVHPGRGRVAELAAARQVAYYLLTRCGKLGPAEVGRLLNRDHGTVTHGADRVAAARHDHGSLLHLTYTLAVELLGLTPPAARARGEQARYDALTTPADEARATWDRAQTRRQERMGGAA